MRVIPAIDLIDGHVVRLTQGDFSQEARYALSPIEAARQWKKHGFHMVHLVSLDGAKDGVALYEDVLRSVVSEGLAVQFGGGIRTLEQIGSYLDLGVERVMVGTVAIQPGSFWRDAEARFGADRLVLALDLKDGFVATHGWTQTTGLSFDAAIERIGADHVRHVLVTDVLKDGSLSGVDVGLYERLLATYPGLNVIPAGGVTSPGDLLELERICVRDVVVGKALYERPEIIDTIRNRNYLA